MSRDVSVDHSQFAAFNHIAALVLVADKNGNILFANDAVHNILGYFPREVLGQKWYKLTDSAHLNIDQRIDIVGQMANGSFDIEKRKLHESLLKAKDGKLVWTQWTNKKLESGLVVGVGQDITDKKKLKDSIILKNKENEMLLQEIHHRVKNNLQIISSLLNLQFKNFEGELVQKAIDKSKARINAMALVHNMLYSSKNLTAIDFKAYLTDLTTSICRAYGCTHPVNLNITVSEAAFDVDLTINLGLIITELVSNIYEHAYDADMDKFVSISLNKINDHSYQILIEDAGKGMIREEHDLAECFGLELVESLCGQINGSMKILNGQGTTVDLRF